MKSIPLSVAGLSLRDLRGVPRGSAKLRCSTQVFASAISVSILLVAAPARSAPQPETQTAQAEPGKPSSGSATDRVLALRQAIEHALASGFDVRLAQIAVEAARGDARSLADVANPAASVGYGRALGYHPSNCDAGSTCSPNQYSFGLSDQAALNGIFSGKYGLRREIGQKSVRVASLQRDDAVRLAKLTIKQQFAAVVFSQARIKLADRALQTAGELPRLVQIRYNAGAPLPDLLRAQAVLLGANQRVQAAQIQLTADRAQLALFMGRARDWLRNTEPLAIVVIGGSLIVALTSRLTKPAMLIVLHQSFGVDAGLDDDRTTEAATPG